MKPLLGHGSRLLAMLLAAWLLSACSESTSPEGNVRLPRSGGLTVALAVLDTAIGTVGVFGGMGLLGLLYILAVLLPGIGVTIRRLHDTGRSGWWILVGFIPLVGGIILLVLAVLKGTDGENAYGPSARPSPAG